MPKITAKLGYFWAMKKFTCCDVHDNFLGVWRRRVAGVRAAVDGLRLRDDEWRRRDAVTLVNHDRPTATPVVRYYLKSDANRVPLNWTGSMVEEHFA